MTTQHILTTIWFKSGKIRGVFYIFTENKNQLMTNKHETPDQHDEPVPNHSFENEVLCSDFWFTFILYTYTLANPANSR